MKNALCLVVLFAVLACPVAASEPAPQTCVMNGITYPWGMCPQNGASIEEPTEGTTEEGADSDVSETWIVATILTNLLQLIYE